MKIKAKVREMKEADVSFISLVSRGANRIPFRVVKSQKESNMIDLSKPLKILKGEKAAPKQVAPEIVGVVVVEQADPSVMESVTKALAEHGFPLDTTTKHEDGTVMFSAEAPDLTDTSVVRLSEDMAVVVKGFSPYAEALSQSADFNEVMATQGFHQGIRTACDALTSTVWNVLAKSESPSAAATGVSEVLGKFSKYVSTLTSALPEKAFKADFTVSELLKKAQTDKEAAALEALKSEKEVSDPAPEGVDAAEWEKMTPEQKEEWKAKAKAAKDEAPEDGKDSGEKIEDESSAQKSEKSDTGLEAVLAQLGELSLAIKGVVGEVAGVAQAQKSLEGRVEEIARKADTAANAVKTTVVAGAGAGDEPAKGGQVQKSDDDPRTGFFDTAFLPKRR